MTKLNEEEIAYKLERAAGWSREDVNWIVKTFRFDAYMEGIQFVQEIARISERELNHHPLIAIDYKLVRLRLTSWRAGGLTDLDFAAASRYDAVFNGQRDLS
ncbi:4a-hydroxytetrahydrobiopterin dehydratase [Paenibacillus sp. UNC451MF]|uniref:4a-hydroxytetrahydrobiopterin dehydratase n=1 Tax=Paenibacillus sp. UNC451MF TaxID=1449063 RepID=UPI0005678410|nr:4a-hydroxytetrahydrobiopterin dehydratase [Paenibacillus sp. UNC451MF]